jgi:hypothetical protein
VVVDVCRKTVTCAIGFAARWRGYCTFTTSCSSRVTLETSSRATLAGRHAGARTNEPNEHSSETLRKQYTKSASEPRSCCTAGSPCEVTHNVSNQCKAGHNVCLLMLWDGAKCFVLFKFHKRNWCQSRVEQPGHTNAPTIASYEHCHDRAFQSRTGRVEHEVVKVQ